eukprot:EG_transcript_30488
MVLPEMSPVSREDEVDVDVTWEDQKKICTFGRMNQRMLEIESEVKERKEDIEKINDAANEIYIADDIKFVLGEAFVAMSVERVEELLEERKALLEKEIADLDMELEGIQTTMKEFKAQLYAKFGKSIYLENE